MMEVIVTVTPAEPYANGSSFHNVLAAVYTDHAALRNLLEAWGLGGRVHEADILFEEVRMGDGGATIRAEATASEGTMRLQATGPSTHVREDGGSAWRYAGSPTALDGRYASVRVPPYAYADGTGVVAWDTIGVDGGTGIAGLFLDYRRDLVWADVERSDGPEVR